MLHSVAIRSAACQGITPGPAKSGSSCNHRTPTLTPLPSPDPDTVTEQRGWRTITRGKQQLIRDRVRLQNQLEALLEEGRIELSSVISDLFGVSGRILQAMAGGESHPHRLAALGDDRLQCSAAVLADALDGSLDPIQRALLKLYLERLHLLDQQIGQLDRMIATALRQHQEAVIRVAEIPGFGVDSAQQLIAEMGVDAEAFSTAGQFASWSGVCGSAAWSGKFCPLQNSGDDFQRSGFPRLCYPKR